MRRWSSSETSSNRLKEMDLREALVSGPLKGILTETRYAAERFLDDLQSCNHPICKAYEAYFLTIAGGQRVDIETDRLLGLIGQSVGLTLAQTIPMEMLVSRDIFKKNAVASESILFFRK